MDLQEIKFFLCSLGYTAEFLPTLEKYERDFLIERAEELNIRGMKEFLSKKDFSFIKKRRTKAVMEKTTGIIYESISDLGKTLGIKPASALSRINNHPEQYKIL